MDEPSRAAPELRRRLAKHVRVVGQTIVLRDRRPVHPILEGIVPPSGRFTVAALPASTPWTVRCTSEGLDLAFGSSVRGEVSIGDWDVGPDLVISLTNVELSEQQCFALVVLVAEAVVDLLNGKGDEGPN
jgi:hypothetical protein